MNENSFNYKDFALTCFEIEARANSGMAYSQSPIPYAQSNLFSMPLVYFKTKEKVQVEAPSCKAGACC